MSVVITTVPVTVTASQSVVVVTSTIAASDPSIATASPPSATRASSSATASYDSGGTDGSGSATASDSGSGSSNSPAGSNPSSSSSSSSSNKDSLPIGGTVGGTVGGVVLVAFIIVLACLIRKRRKAKKDANLFPALDDEKGPSVIAGLPPNPSTTQLRLTSGNYSNSIVMTDAASALPLLGADRSLHSGSHTGPLVSEAHSSHMHRLSAASLAPSFMMGSSASFPQSHSSHYGQPVNSGLPSGSQDYAAGYGYPDVHRSAFYEPPMPPGVDPRVMPVTGVAAGSAAAAYHSRGAVAGMPGSSANVFDPRVHATAPGMSSLPTGAAPSDYAAVSEAARTRGMHQAAASPSGFDSAWSGAASLTDTSSRRGSHGSSLAMHPAVTHLSEASGPAQHQTDNAQRRPPAAGFPGQQSNLNTIPGSVAVSEIASADHHSMNSGVLSQRGDLSVPPKLPSIPASSPLILQDSTAFAPQTSSATAAGGPRLTALAGADTFQSSNGTYNSDGTYNTYTGAAKGQLRVVGGGSTDAHGTIVEEEAHNRAPKRDMSGDLKNGEFWVDASGKPSLGAAGKRLGQHSANKSTSSINKTGSRMIEMLDTDEQPDVPTSVTGPDEPSPKQTTAPSRPSFWKERTKSSQSITKVFRNSPLTNAHATPSDRSPAAGANSTRFGVANDAESPRSNGTPRRATETEQLPPLDLGRSVTSSSDSPKAVDGDADMWKESSKAKSGTNAMRKWTKKKPGKSSSKGNAVDIDQLFG